MHYIQTHLTKIIWKFILIKCILFILIIYINYNPDSIRSVNGIEELHEKCKLTKICISYLSSGNTKQEIYPILITLDNFDLKNDNNIKILLLNKFNSKNKSYSNLNDIKEGNWKILEK